MTSAPPSTPEPPQTAYLRTKVLTSSPEQLRLMLLEGAVKFARQGCEGLVSKNHEASFTGLSRARNIVVELLTSVPKETEATLRSRLQALYSFIFKLLVDASFEKDAEKAEKAADLLEYERETWEMAMRKAAEERGSGLTSVATPGAEARPALSVQA